MKKTAYANLGQIRFFRPSDSPFQDASVTLSRVAILLKIEAQCRSGMCKTTKPYQAMGKSG